MEREGEAGRRERRRERRREGYRGRGRVIVR